MKNHTPSRKVRSDKGENRVNTTTKYALYAFFSFLGGFILSYVFFPRIEEKTIHPTRPSYIPEIVCGPPKIEKEYVSVPCHPVTKDNQ